MQTAAFSLILSLLVSCYSYATTVCLPNATAPYSDGTSQSGLHVDIINAAFQQVNEPTTVIFLPNNRLEPSFTTGKCDMSGHLKINTATKPFYFTNSPMMTFHNNVISRKKLQLNYRSPQDLTTYKVAAFQNAHKFLGDEYLKMSQANPNYREYGGALPAQLLLLDRIDVVISEPNIFLYYLQKQITLLPEEVRTNIYPDLKWAPFNKKGNAYYWGFRTLSLKEKFEQGLRSIYQNGQFDEIFKRWSMRYNLLRTPLANMDCTYGNIATACLNKTRLKVVFGLSRPPFIHNSPPSGISWELATDVFDRMGKEIMPSFAPNARMSMALSQGLTDVAVEVQPTDPSLFYSAPFISYQNYVFLHPSSQVAFKQWSDLTGQKVCAWQGALQDLGEEFEAASANFGTYREFGEQKHQVQRWMIGSCEAVIIDKTIFFWWVNELKTSSTLQAETPPNVDAKAFPLPKQNELWWFVGFTSEELRDSFNQHLAESIADGTYDKIRNRHLPAFP